MLNKMYAMYQRPQLQLITARVAEPRRHIQVMLGPRQVGKTTLIEQLLQNVTVPYLFVTADEAQSEQGNLWIDQQWERARIQLNASGAQAYLLIFDEIQKIKEWSNTIKKNWDSDTFNKTNIKVIILGSAQMLLQKGLTESLAGRFEIIRVNHWSFAEMEAAFGLTPQQFAWFGGFPGTAFLINDEKRWKSYVNDALIETTLMKDILMMARIDKPSLLRQLFDLACHYSGQILSFNKMLGQLQEAGNSSTLQNYLHLLEGAGFVAGIPKYYQDVLHQKSSIPKLQALNTAFIAARSVKRFGDIVMQPAEWGRVIESTIGAHLLNDAQEGGYEVYYWRERNDEVDFILKKEGTVIALEVKSGTSNKTKGMQVFNKQFKPHKVLMVGINGIRWEDFLRLKPGALF